MIVLLPKKVIDYPFYFLVGAPALAILLADVMESYFLKWKIWLRYLFLSIFLLLALRSFLLPVFDFQNSDKKVQKIGEYVKKITQLYDKIIAQHGSSLDLLYYCGRTGWTFDFNMNSMDFRHPDTVPLKRLLGEGYGNDIARLEERRRRGAAFWVISETEKFNKEIEFSSCVSSKNFSANIAWVNAITRLTFGGF